MAVTEWFPDASVVVAWLLACPVPSSVTGVPKLEPSTRNCTVPVGVPLPGATTETAAVKVTDWPKTDGLAEEATVVVVPAAFTVWPPDRVPLLAVKLPVGL